MDCESLRHSATRFRAPTPPGLTSSEYTTAYDGVKLIDGDGVLTPTIRTGEQTDIGTSGHAGFGGALFQTLRNFYKTDNIASTFTSDEFNGITRDNKGNVRPIMRRSLSSLSQAEEENGQSRIYLGVHWVFDKTEGIAQGAG